jgi:hypothetical protein
MSIPVAFICIHAPARGTQTSQPGRGQTAGIRFYGRSGFGRSFARPEAVAPRFQGGFFDAAHRTAFTENERPSHCKRSGVNSGMAAGRGDSQPEMRDPRWGILFAAWSVLELCGRAYLSARGILAGLFVYHCSFNRKLERALAVSASGPGIRRAGADRARALAGLFQSNPAQERLPVLCGLSGLRCGGLIRLPFSRF